MKYLVADPAGKVLSEIPPMHKENAEWVADALCAAFHPLEYKAVPEKGEPEDEFKLIPEDFP